MEPFNKLTNLGMDRKAEFSFVQAEPASGLKNSLHGILFACSIGIQLSHRRLYLFLLHHLFPTVTELPCHICSIKYLLFQVMKEPNPEQRESVMPITVVSQSRYKEYKS